MVNIIVINRNNLVLQCSIAFCYKKRMQKCFQKMHREWQKVQTMIKLLLMEQYVYGLHFAQACLSQFLRQSVLPFKLSWMDTLSGEATLPFSQFCLSFQ